jgi:hypothetical protein
LFLFFVCVLRLSCPLSDSQGEHGWVKVSLRRASGIVTWYTKLHAPTYLPPSANHSNHAQASPSPNHSHATHRRPSVSTFASSSSSVVASSTTVATTAATTAVSTTAAPTTLEIEEARGKDLSAHVQTLLTHLIEKQAEGLADAEISEEEEEVEEEKLEVTGEMALEKSYVAFLFVMFVYSYFLVFLLLFKVESAC